MTHPAVRTALEWFRASGAKTRKRLDYLVAFYGAHHGVMGEHLIALQADAWSEWQKGNPDADRP